MLPLFHNSKISIPNKSASPFRKDDFNLKEVDQSIETVIKYFDTIVMHLKALCSGFNFGGQYFN